MLHKLEFKNVSLLQLPEVASGILRLGENTARSKVYAFYGQMGAGKTTLIKEMSRQLGSTDRFSSPTYNLVNEYAIEGSRVKIYHLDLFRLKSLDEALDLGVADYLNGNNYCFIEWPELVEGILADSTVKVKINGMDNMREMIIFIK